MTNMTITQITTTHRLAKRSWMRGYVSRRSAYGEIIPYTGIYGSGYKVTRPSWESTRYCIVEYWIA